MKLFVRSVQFFLLTSGLALILLPKHWLWYVYDVRYTGIAMLIGATILYSLPRFAHVHQSALRAEHKNRAVDSLQIFLAIAFTGDALGGLGLYGLYQFGVPYDKVLHFLVPLLAALLLPFILRDRYGWNRTQSIAATFGLVIGSALMWELFEFGADMILHTHLSGELGNYISSDTKYDLLFGGLGAVIGSGISIFRAWWGLRHNNNYWDWLSIQRFYKAQS